MIYTRIPGDAARKVRDLNPLCPIAKKKYARALPERTQRVECEFESAKQPPDTVASIKL